MRINNNLMAMNTHRQLGIANAGGAKSMEKLSSGFRINRAGDDAAGLAISEKMRGQIRGLDRASTNAQDAISLIQTTEGALNETHAILQRMRELAVQSATDTNTNADRANLQDEIDQLATEITRISTDTEFNTMKVLNGEFEGKVFHIGANSEQNISFDVNDMGAEALEVKGEKTRVSGIKISGLEVYTREDSVNLEIATADSGSFEIKKSSSGKITIQLEMSGKNVKTTNAELKSALEGLGFDTVTTEKFKADSKSGASGDIKLSKDTLSGEFGINISTQVAADKAITTVNDALEKVSKERSKLGAIQNRLEHTIKNLDTSAENLQASESRIRDVDMAKEMMEQTKQNILQQASTAMLAQANMAPQSVLQLLG